MLNGTIRWWKPHGEYKNHLVQIYLKAEESVYIYNGYMEADEIKTLNSRLSPHLDNIKVTIMSEKRNEYYNKFVDWLQKKQLKSTINVRMFITGVAIMLLDYKNGSKQMVMEA